MNLKKIIWILGLVVLIVSMAGLSYGIYLYNKPHVDVANQEAIQQLAATDLMQIYTDNEEEANANYLDQIIQVEGTVREVLANVAEGTAILLATQDDFGSVSCTFMPNQLASIKDIKVGDQIKLKGLCTGMLMDVVLVRCVLLKN